MLHEAYLQYRLGGAERPDPEIYRRAIEQFQSLPGASDYTAARARGRIRDNR